LTLFRHTPCPTREIPKHTPSLFAGPGVLLVRKTGRGRTAPQILGRRDLRRTTMRRLLQKPNIMPKIAKYLLLPGLLALALAPSLFAQISVFASGLNNPRGLKWGPDGNLYVAEGGAGGTLSTIGICPQVPGLGPYTGGFTSRVLKISADGSTITPAAENLPLQPDQPWAGQPDQWRSRRCLHRTQALYDRGGSRLFAWPRGYGEWRAARPPGRYHHDGCQSFRVSYDAPGRESRTG
jgi:hypothetical protein